MNEINIHCMKWWWNLFINTIRAKSTTTLWWNFMKNTVDGSEILHHLRCIKPCKLWDKLPTSTGERRISAIKNIKFNHSTYVFTTEQKCTLKLPRKSSICRFRFVQFVWSELNGWSFVRRSALGKLRVREEIARSLRKTTLLTSKKKTF